MRNLHLSHWYLLGGRHDGGGRGGQNLTETCLIKDSKNVDREGESKMLIQGHTFLSCCTSSSCGEGIVSFTICGLVSSEGAVLGEGESGDGCRRKDSYIGFLLDEASFLGFLLFL